MGAGWQQHTGGHGVKVGARGQHGCDSECESEWACGWAGDHGKDDSGQCAWASGQNKKVGRLCKCMSGKAVGRVVHACQCSECHVRVCREGKKACVTVQMDPYPFPPHETCCNWLSMKTAGAEAG